MEKWKNEKIKIPGILYMLTFLLGIYEFIHLNIAIF
jgi:hypothetical protein